MFAAKLVPVTPTHSDEVGTVVVKDRFDFNLLSADRRVRQPQVNEEFLPNNYLQRVANADSFKENKHQKRRGQKHTHTHKKEDEVRGEAIPTVCFRQADSSKLPGCDRVLQGNVFHQ